MAASSTAAQAIPIDGYISRDLHALDIALALSAEPRSAQPAEERHERQARILDMIIGDEPIESLLHELGCFVEQEVPGSRCKFTLRRSANALHVRGQKPFGDLHLAVSGVHSGDPTHKSVLHTAVRLAELATERHQFLGGSNGQERLAHLTAPEPLPASRVAHRLGSSLPDRRLERDLRCAANRGELQLYYQPQVDLDARLVGMEALIRWNHPIYGLLGPDKFVRMAEETSLIVPIGEWVMREACRQCAEWNRSVAAPVRVAVNVSSLQLYFSDLPQVVYDSLQTANLPAGCLEVELTETTLMRDIDSSANSLQKLRDLGVTVAIDDFGTGYSSLSYLEKLPVDRLKIDRSFLQHIQAPPSAAIVQAIATLGRSLGLEVVAEGIETLSQVETIRQIGIDIAQGFFFGHPMPAQQAFNLIAGARLTGQD